MLKFLVTRSFTQYIVPDDRAGTVYSIASKVDSPRISSTHEKMIPISSRKYPHTLAATFKE